MSKFLTPRNLAIAGAGAAAIYIFPKTSFGKNTNPLKTPGVQQMEDRFTSGGGTPTHTPAVATRTGMQGSTEHASPPVEKSKGYGTKHYEENVASQRSDKETRSSEIGKKWASTQVGSEHGR